MPYLKVETQRLIAHKARDLLNQLLLNQSANLDYLKLMKSVTEMAFSVNNVIAVHEYDLNLLQAFCQLFFAISFKQSAYLSLY